MSDHIAEVSKKGDLISRADVIDALWKIKDERDSVYYTSAIYTIIDTIEQMSSAQSETAKRIVGKSRDGMTLWYQCDMCNEPVDVQDDYCRGCGRRLIDE